ERVIALKEAILEAFHATAPEAIQARQITRAKFSRSHWQKGIVDEGELFVELDILFDYVQLLDEGARTRKAHKQASDTLLAAVVEKYPMLGEEEITSLVLEDKWFATIRAAVEGEVEHLTHALAIRIKQLE